MHVFAAIVTEERLSTLDSLSRLRHYVAMLNADWTSLVQNATKHRNDLDEALEVRMLLSW